MRSSEDYGALKVYVIVLNGNTDMINKTISCHCNGGILGWTLLIRFVSSLVNDGLSNADIAVPRHLRAVLCSQFAFGLNMTFSIGNVFLLIVQKRANTHLIPCSGMNQID